ncbi:MAG: CDP-diacylglycerol--glycerol-3-phosphate 3-phosphatidyltransferase [Lachnospiraceae bacterium]|nr:CDP-diacylglycerol--glycerol-3-phosphate 3-phosphatidyltransferase [Lachnospiraceae bacterium]
MNLPNKITIFRVILIPFFLVALLVDAIPAGKWIALVIFIVASLSDMVDGKLARKYNLVTDFGKFMDPLADKLLTCSAMIAMISLNLIPSWVVIVIIAREFTISGFRLIASDNGKVIAANMWGKVKTTVQMIMIIYLIVKVAANWDSLFFNVVAQVLIYAALALTVISLMTYILGNKDVLSSSK